MLELFNPFTTRKRLLASSKDNLGIPETSYYVSQVFIKFVSAFWTLGFVFMTF